MPSPDLLNNQECETSLHYPQGQGRTVSKNKLRVTNLDLKLLQRKNRKPTLPKDTNACFLSTPSNFPHQSTVQVFHSMKKNGENLKFKEFIYLNLYCWLPLYVDLLPHHLWYLSVAMIFYISVFGTMRRTISAGPGQPGFISDPRCRMAKQPPRNTEEEFNLRW